MKPKLFLLAAAFSGGIAILHAEDPPKKPQAPGGEFRPGDPGGPGGPGNPKARGEEAFKKMDANNDGKVSKDEFMEFTKKESEARYNKLDTTGTGSFTQEQFMEAMRRMHSGEGVPRRPEGFNKPEGGGTRPRPGGDNNAPGNPPPPPREDGDARGGPDGPGKHRGGMVDLFHKMKENGSVTKEEFIKMSEEQFKRMDANGDGKITREEMEELGKKIRDLRGGKDGDRPKRPEAD